MGRLFTKQLQHPLLWAPMGNTFCVYLQVPRPDGKPDNLGLLVLDEPSTKQSDPTVLSLWLTENSKQHNITVSHGETGDVYHSLARAKSVHFTLTFVTYIYFFLLVVTTWFYSVFCFPAAFLSAEISWCSATRKKKR